MEFQVQSVCICVCQYEQVCRHIYVVQICATVTSLFYNYIISSDIFGKYDNYPNIAYKITDLNYV